MITLSPLKYFLSVAVQLKSVSLFFEIRLFQRAFHTLFFFKKASSDFY